MASDDASPTSAALSFGRVADAYDRGRPDYPLDAARWLAGDEPCRVLELGAGTGKLTRALVALGHDVHATDPDPQMLDRVAVVAPEARLSQTRAEDIPAADASYDVVVVGQAFHWFDPAKALPEIARVLVRGGSLALAWNVRDERIPWVKRFGALLGGVPADDADPHDAIDASPHFGPLEEATFKHWQVIDRSSVQDLALSRSNISTLEPEAREARIAEVLAFYDDFGRGMDGMQLPYLTKCFRAVVGIRPVSAAPRPPLTTEGGPAVDADVDDDGPRQVRLAPAAEPPADDDSGMLLIDFR